MAETYLIQMRGTSLFLIVLLSGIASYVIVAMASATLLAQTQPNYGGMMGMGGWWGTQVSTQSPYASLMLLLSIAALVVTIVGGVGLVYTFFKPEPATTQPQSQTPKENVETAMPTTTRLETTKTQEDVVEATLKVLKSDELLVIELLKKNDNHYLQKWISKDTGMSRLKTHRVVARLEERNLVVLTKSGNTNNVSLAPWFIGDKKQPG